MQGTPLWFFLSKFFLGRIQRCLDSHTSWVLLSCHAVLRFYNIYWVASFQTYLVGHVDVFRLSEIADVLSLWSCVHWSVSVLCQEVTVLVGRPWLNRFVSPSCPAYMTTLHKRLKEQLLTQKSFKSNVEERVAGNEEKSQDSAKTLVLIELSEVTSSIKKKRTETDQDWQPGEEGLVSIELWRECSSNKERSTEADQD